MVPHNILGRAIQSREHQFPQHILGGESIGLDRLQVGQGASMVFLCLRAGVLERAGALQ